jgi:hypothetical protein
MSEDYMGAQNGAVNKELKDEIVETALAHHIMTQYTSFVAVDEKTVSKNGKLQTITVPVEMPDGVARENVFGKDAESAQMQASPRMLKSKAAYRHGAFAKSLSGSFNGSFNGPAGAAGYPAAGTAGGGLMRSMMAQKAAPAYGGGGGAAFMPPPPCALPSPMSMPISMAKQQVAQTERSEAMDQLSNSTPVRSRLSGQGGNRSDQANNEKKKGHEERIEILAVADKSIKGIVDSKEQKNESSKNVSLSKLSKSAQLLIKNAGAQIKGLTRKGAQVMVVIKVQTITADQMAKLKALGLDIVKDKEVEGEIRGLIKVSKLIDLANLNFVLSVLLDSDRK